MTNDNIIISHYYIRLLVRQMTNRII